MQLRRLLFIAAAFLFTISAVQAQAPADRFHYHGAFSEAPLREIHPDGWLKEFLRRQSDGLTGHLEAAGYPFNTPGWDGTAMERFGWTAYEQYAYWVDGMMRCGELLRDSALIAKASEQVDYVLTNADPDGYLGPKFLKPHSALSRWPHVVFFRAMMARFGATGERRIVDALQRNYLSKTDPFTSHRNVVNVEIMLWTYAQTHDPELLKIAEESYAGYNRESPEVTTLDRMRSDEKMDNFHGVTFNETAKLAAALYLYTGKAEYLAAVEHAYEKVDRYYMLLDGVLSSTEGMRGIDPLQSHETCDIADYSWALGYLLMATGKSAYADAIERACFNAAPGAVTKDFTALQYFSCPNQVVADRTSNHNEFSHGSAWMSYRPNPGTECCAGNVHRIMPNFVSRMWMLDSSGAPAATFYGPSRFTFRAGSDSVTIEEETAYPFDDEIRFTIHAPRPVTVPLVVRLPGWCKTPEISVRRGSRAETLRPASGQFFRIARTFRNGDVVVVKLPMALRATSWPEGGVALERGPLVYALSVPSSQTIDSLDRRSTREFPAWNMEPAGRWNYAVSIPDSNLDRYVRIERRQESGFPWEQRNAPVTLRVPARLVANWDLDLDSQAPGRRFTPPLPLRSTLRERLSAALDTITLVPYGCTELRVSIFPLDGDYEAVTGRLPEADCSLKSSYGEDSLRVRINRESQRSDIHYTLDGSEPTEASPVYHEPFLVTHTATIKAKAFSSVSAPSFLSATEVTVLHRLPSVTNTTANPGLSFKYFEGSWNALPDFSSLPPANTGVVATWDLGAFKHRDENWGVVFDGYLTVPREGYYKFFVTSDDGSRLLLDGTTILDNDGGHSARERSGFALLDAGSHRIRLLFFQGTGGMALSVDVTPPGLPRQSVPASWLGHN